MAKPHLARISVSKFRPHLAKPHLARISVRSVLAKCVFVCGVCVLCCVCCVFKIFGGCLQDFWWVSSRFLVGVFKIFGGCLQDLPDRPKFRSFFSLSRRKFHSEFSLWGVFSLNFGGVFEGRGAQMCMFGVLWLSCEAPAALVPPGLHTTDISVARRFKHHQNSTRRPPRERRKNEISGGREKKREISGPPPFGPPPLRAPTPSGPHPFGPPPLRAPNLSGPQTFGPPLLRAPTPSGPNPFRPTFQGLGQRQKKEKWIEDDMKRCAHEWWMKGFGSFVHRNVSPLLFLGGQG